jgi:2-oxo-4-hydroxy-4-carboxy-5-ureidoimidazoline decarboxylase
MKSNISSDKTNDTVVNKLNGLDRETLQKRLFGCCGSTKWLQEILMIFPVQSLEELHLKAEKIWLSLDEASWLEAFSHHPKIGDLSQLKEKFAATASWSSQEQSSVSSAGDEVLRELQAGNIAYEEKFGFIFIVCATGKTATQMLTLLKERIGNERAKELQIAAGEQAKILHLRLDKFLNDFDRVS